MLITTVICIVLLTVGIVLLKSSMFDLIGIILSSLAGGGLFLVLIIWPIEYFSYQSSVQQYLVVKQTIEQSRANTNISDMERANLLNKIIEINKDLADAKYWNHTIFGDCIPDDYANLEYLK